MTDPIRQEQLTHTAKALKHATVADISICITIHKGEIQTAIAAAGDGSRDYEAKVETETMRALAMTADAIMRKGTHGAYRLLIMGPNGVQEAGAGLESVTIERQRG